MIAAGLLGTELSPAGAANAAAPGAAAKPSYTIENLYINRRVGDYLVSVAGGTDQAATTLTISRGRQSAAYYTKDWHLEGKQLSVHFGDLGYLRMTFHGAPRASTEVMSHIHKGDQLLELNCGTGIDAMYFAEQGIRVHATDNAPGMLEQLNDKLAGSPLKDRITLQACSFNNLEQLGAGAVLDAGQHGA